MGRLHQITILATFYNDFVFVYTSVRQYISSVQNMNIHIPCLDNNSSSIFIEGFRYSVCLETMA